MIGHGRFEPLDERAAPRGEHRRRDAAIGFRRPSAHELGLFATIDEPDHRRTIHVEYARELDLLDAGVRLDEQEHGELRRRERGRTRRRGERIEDVKLRAAQIIAEIIFEAAEPNGARAERGRTVSRAFFGIGHASPRSRRTTENTPEISVARDNNLTPDFSGWYGTSVTSEVRRVAITHDGAIAHLRLDRAAKRNALDDRTIAELHTFFEQPGAARVAVLDGAGDHFCAGLDLAEHVSRDARDVTAHSAGWHDAFDAIQFGKVPLVVVMHGATVGGGFELAAAAHVRIAERSAFFALPEGQRGIFLGGGGSVRLTRLIGTSRVLEMMLTGRRYTADDAERIGAVHYVVDDGAGLAFGLDLARTIASNAAHSNAAILQALPRIADMSHAEGMFAETMTAALMATEDESRARIAAFLDRKGTTRG